MNRRVFPAAFACLLFAAPVVAQPAPPSLGADIVMVRVAGPWEAGGQRGFSRLVVSAAGGQIALSVEWISDAGMLVKTLPLPAQPGVEQLPLSRVRNTQTADGSTVTFDTEDGDTFVLMPGAPGEATFGPATN